MKIQIQIMNTTKFMHHNINKMSLFQVQFYIFKIT